LRTEVRATEETFGRSGLTGHMIDLPKVELHPPLQPRATFNTFDLSNWGSPQVAAAPRPEPSAPEAPKLEAQIIDLPKTTGSVQPAAPATEPANGEPQVIDVPLGDSHAAL